MYVLFTSFIARSVDDMEIVYIQKTKSDAFICDILIHNMHSQHK